MCRRHVNLLRRSGLDAAPLVENSNPVRQGQGLCLIMGDKNCGDAQFF
jgi:hypothetical protein